jgi:CheY-like chemotaxis protein
MLQTRLELAEGYQVLVAANGNDGLALVSKERPDLVLMDLNLPDIDGWEVTRRLKADPQTADIPVIALTAHAMSGDRERALAAGCDEFDTKPVDFERLLQKMKSLLDGSV